MPQPLERTRLCPAGKLLSAWLEKHGRTKKWLAERAKCSRQALVDWMKGTRPPPIAYAERIREATQGDVPISAWVRRQPKVTRPNGRSAA